MTDIVARLRACPGVMSHDPECNCTEAADEIERLREQLLAVLKHVEDLRGERDVARAGCARLRREIEGRHT